MSETRRAILRCIARHQAEHGWSPSVRELAREVGRSTSTVHQHLVGLQRQGFIQRGIGPRQIRLVETAPAGEERGK